MTRRRFKAPMEGLITFLWFSCWDQPSEIILFFDYAWRQEYNLLLRYPSYYKVRRDDLIDV